VVDVPYVVEGFSVVVEALGLPRSPTWSTCPTRC